MYQVRVTLWLAALGWGTSVSLFVTVLKKYNLFIICNHCWEKNLRRVIFVHIKCSGIGE